jgi:DNA-binding CsgD family transcriptional regulator
VFSQSGFTQLSYQISNYEINNLGAGNQNWDIESDGKQRIFVANNHGLLVLENTNIRLFEIEERTVFRSVAYLNDRVYTGSFEDFGFWEENEEGEFHYTSLAAKLENPAMNNDEIWKIIEHQNRIYFHSFGSIYGYDGENVYRVPKDGSFMFLHQTGERVFTQRIQGGLFELNNDEFTKIPNSDFLNNEEVKSIIQWEEDSYLIGTTLGIYTFENGQFSTWTGESSEQVVKNNLNTMIKAGDKLVIGTILDGLFVYDQDFRLSEHINNEQQLQNNTVLALEVDPLGNIWVGMDKGLTYIAFDTPIHTYNDASQGIGSVYAASLFNNQLYVGTNQGVFRYDRDENGNFYNRNLIPGSQGQVWFLKVVDDRLYAGLNDGTYTIEGLNLQKVSSTFGGYTLKEPVGITKNVLVQSTYSDLLVYEYLENTWRQSYALEGFSAPARFLEFDHLGNIWLGHAVKGIYKLQPNITFNSIDQVQKIGTDQALPQSTNRVFKLDNRIMTSYRDTLYQWDSIDKSFVPYFDIDPLFTESGTIQNIVPAGNQRWWVVKHQEVMLIEMHFNSIRVLYRLLPEMYDFDLVAEYENVIALSNSLHLICLDEGFAILNLDKLDQNQYATPFVSIQKVESVTLENGQNPAVYKPIRDNELAYRANTIQFHWTTSQMVGNQTFFQYKLDGLDTDWSSWTTETNTQYLRLPSGRYTFHVRSIGINGMLTETESYVFVVKKPWYLTGGFILLYVVIIASFGFMIRLYITRKRWRAISEELEHKHTQMRRDREKAEKEIIKLTNDKLQSEVEHKSAQLASNTMAMMRKNNLLNSIKEELDKQRKEWGDKVPDRYFNQMHRLIDQGIEDEHEWEVFEQLYDQAHGDFFKRLKKKYPQLTPSDLRLCAYLRMNLSSKEISPLLNISVRGVEERRYRLRKRLNLSTNTNLNELIMTF